MLNLRTLAFLSAFAAPAVAQAQQLLVFDDTYTAKEQEGPGDKFHHSVKPFDTQPANWRAPVDYSKGTVYIHQEVKTKPSNRPTVIDICFDGDLAGYGCIDTAPYTDVGVHETVKPLTDMWQYEKVAWAKKRTVYHLVIKDPALGGTPGGKPVTDFVPSDMRIVFTIVPAGGTYVPPASTGGGGGAGPSADGGAAIDAPVDAGAGSVAVDAAAPPSSPPPTAEPTPDAAPATTTPPPSGGGGTPPATTEPPPPVIPPPPPGGCAMGGSGVAVAWPLLVLGLAFLRSRRRAR